MQFKKLAIVTFSVAGAAACAHHKPSASAPSMAMVSARTGFVVTMADVLSSDTARAGDTFTATLTEPIRSGDGRVVAEPGAALKGHVVAVQSGDEPRLAITFDSIATRGGAAIFVVRVTRASDDAFTVATTRRDPEVDADLVVRESSLAVGGGPGAEGSAPPAKKAFIPKGARLELALESPLSVAMPK